MPLEWITCEQGSPEWFAARRGIPTASRFSDVLAKGEGKTRRSYMYELAGEVVTGAVAEGYSNSHMERGKEMEAEARAEFEFLTGMDVVSVGFARNGRAGASPDGILSDGRLVEFKTKLPKLMVETILKGELPSDHKAQCQGALWICEADALEFAAYWPSFPLFRVTVKRDEEFIDKLSDDVARFNAELDAVVEQVRNYRSAA